MLALKLQHSLQRVGVLVVNLVAAEEEFGAVRGGRPDPREGSLQRGVALALGHSEHESAQLLKGLRLVVAIQGGRGQRCHGRCASQGADGRFEPSRRGSVMLKLYQFLQHPGILSVANDEEVGAVGLLRPKLNEGSPLRGVALVLGQSEQVSLAASQRFHGLRLEVAFRGGRGLLCLGPLARFRAVGGTRSHSWWKGVASGAGERPVAASAGQCVGAGIRDPTAVFATPRIARGEVISRRHGG